MTTERERLLQKIRHVQELAERGFDGERESAAATLERLMGKYNISEQEISREYKANTYDLNRNDPEAKRAAQRKRGPLTAAKWALRVAGWAENVLITLVLAWLVFVVGTVLTGTVVVFGKPL